MAELPCFFFVACEPSGDILGSHIMQALRARLNGQVRFAGIGGPRMEAEGLKSLFPQSDLALFGLFELLPKIPHVLKRLQETAAAALKLKPAAVVTIDGPDFSFRLAKKLKGSGIPLVHDVAPSVWAWREGRAKKIARLYNHLLALLPFEPPYFIRQGLACTFTGHPVLERRAGAEEAAAFRALHNIPPGKKILCVLPGSRRSEIKRLAPIFGKTLQHLKDVLADTVVILPSLPEIMPVLEPYLRDWPVKPLLVLDQEEKYAAFRASHAALAASGTVSLELAMADVPHLIAYKMNLLTVMLYRGFIRLKYFNLVNILLNREAVPEKLQFDCTPANLAATMKDLWLNSAVREAQVKDFREVQQMLRAGATSPSEKAANVICEVAHVA